VANDQAQQEERLVVFKLAGDDYAVPIAGVHTVEKMMQVTRVPRAPHFVDGVINLRGEVVPVVNLRRRLDLPEKATDDNTHIVVVLAGEQMVGLMVDEISHVLSLKADAIQPAAQVVGEENRNYISGVAKWEDRMIVLMDLERLVDPAQA
jgi:purine-binding chemotaxis protein CheW